MPPKYEFEPDYAVPPGATLKETIDAKGLSQSDLALRAGLAEKTISQIVNGIAPITLETAEKLELVLGIPARFWNKREASYREALARIEESKRLASDSGWLKEVPLSELIARNYIEGNAGKATLVRHVLRFFGVSSVEAWSNVWLSPCVRLRGPGVQKWHPAKVATWLRMGELSADMLECEPYDPIHFRKALAQIRKLTVESAAHWQKKLIELCAAAGVAVVFVREISGAGVSGVTKWLTKDKALIQVSLKYKTDDELWFTFFHDAAHILLHGKKDVFIHEVQDSDRDAEREANVFSRDILIPKSHADRLPYLKTKSRIYAFAQEIGIAPGLVVGRLQRDNFVSHRFCNDLKVRLYLLDRLEEYRSAHPGKSWNNEEIARWMIAKGYWEPQKPKLRTELATLRAGPKKRSTSETRKRARFVSTTRQNVASQVPQTRREM